MALEVGTATNYRDLLAKIATFASANGWSILEQSETSFYLRGAGTSGLDEIYVGATAYEDAANNRYNFELFGSWGYKAGRAFNKMPMSSGGGVYVYLWNQSMPYWLSVNADRILCFAKIGTVYMSIYLGFLKRFGTEMQYPYPLCIGGCGGSSTVNYSNSTASLISFWSAVYGDANSRARVCLPGGVWGFMAEGGGSALNPRLGIFSPVSLKVLTLITTPDNTYPLYPLYVCGSVEPAVYGEYDGIHWITGYGNASENTLTIDGKNYIVFQDIFRTTYDAFCAMRMD